MPRNLVSLRIRPFSQNKKTLETIRKIRDRAQKAANQSALAQAIALKEEILSRIPAKDAYAKYRDQLKVKVCKIGNVDTAIVTLEVRTVPEEEANKKLTVVYIVPKVSEAFLQLIAEHNPWPLEWLPYKPKKDEAVVVSRRIREDEMAAVKERIDRVYKGVMTGIKEYGIEVEQSKNRKLYLTVDTAWEALRAEFGLDGQNEVPVWRPAVNAVMKRGKFRVDFELALIQDLMQSSDGTVDPASVEATKRFQQMVTPAVRGR